MKNKILKGISIFLTCVFIGYCGVSIGYELKTNAYEAYEQSLIQTDSLPLENGGHVYLEKVRNEKTVAMSLEDFEYVSKKKKSKEINKKLKALFSRMN